MAEREPWQTADNFPWETDAARRKRAAEICARCPAEHIVQHPAGDLLCYCMLDAGHKGEHVDRDGCRFTELFSSTGSYARDMARRAAKKSPA